MIFTFCVMAFVLTVILIRSHALGKKLESNEEQIEQLKQEIEAEKQEAEEIEEYGVRIQTREYTEEIAKDKLGLVNEGEIIFKIEDDAGSE